MKGSIFDRLHASVRELELALGYAERPNTELAERILDARTEQVAREPQQLAAARDSATFLVFSRSGRRYAVRLTGLSDVGPLGAIAPVPGLKSPYLGVTARRGRIVAVLDLPCLFGPREPGPPPTWFVMSGTGEVSCAVAADELDDLIEVSASAISTSMPTFPSLIQRHTVGVTTEGVVIVNLPTLVADPALRIEETAR